MKALFQEQTEELKNVLEHADKFHEHVMAVVEHLHSAWAQGHKVLIAGNGGSAAEAQHFSDEMLGRYKSNRKPFAVVALTADSAAITCIGNDFGYEYVFSRQVEALGNEGDVFIGLSTSGNSKNILNAAAAARGNGMTVVALTGPKGTLKDMADYAIIAPTETPARMQELHLHAIHLICEAFEDPADLERSLSETR